MGFEIRDAIYGDIVLSESEARLLDTFEMQRLRQISQLGNVSLVYPSACHSRFQHSLGTRWMAQKIVRLSELRLSRYEERLLYKCALLHDVAEPAFAHATERLNKIGFPSHEQIVEYILNGKYKDIVLKKRNIKSEFVCDVIKSEEERADIISILSPTTHKSGNNVLRELINGYIDADNLDYLRRDATFLGLPYGNYDDRIFATFRIVKEKDEEHVAFRDTSDTMNAVMSILDSRYTLRKAAYFHHTVIIADDMLLKALSEAMSDENVLDVYDVFICGDYELLRRIKQSNAAWLVDSLLSRNLFKRAYVLDNRAPYELRKDVDRLENEVERQPELLSQLSINSGIDVEGILLDFHPQSGWKDFDRVLIAADNGVVSSLDDRLHDDLSLLHSKYEALWRFMVSTNATNQENRVKLYDACTDHFGNEGCFVPKKSLVETKEIEERLSPAIQDLVQEIPAIDPILKVLLNSNSKWLSRDEIAEKLGLKPATVSHYLTLIDKKVSSEPESGLLARRVGRVKLWSLDKKLREVLENV